MIYQLGIKTIEIAHSPEGWRVHRFIWPSTMKGDPAFSSEEEAVAAVERSAGRSLKAKQVDPTVGPLRKLPTVPASAATVTVPMSPPPAPAVPEPKAIPAAARAGKLDAFRHLMGVRGDAEVASLSGSTVLGVKKHRERHGIPEAPTNASTSPEAPTKPPTSPKAKKAPEVQKAPEAQKPILTGVRTSNFDAHAEIVGVLTDQEVARRAGVTDEAVRQYRVKRQIPAPRKEVEPSAARVPAPTTVEPSAAAKLTAPETPASGSPGKAASFRRSKLDMHRDIIGVLSDREVA